MMDLTKSDYRPCCAHAHLPRCLPLLNKLESYGSEPVLIFWDQTNCLLEDSLTLILSWSRSGFLFQQEQRDVKKNSHMYFPASVSNVESCD
jgi:hypothetical protein